MSTQGMEEPSEFDIVIKKGAEFSLPLTLEDADGYVNLTGYTFKAQVRTLPNEGGSLLIDLTVNTLSAVSGSIQLYAAASATAALSGVTPTPPQRFYPAYYDLFAAPSAATGTQDKCYLQGMCKIYPRASVR
jgi:hypothetical protein